MSHNFHSQGVFVILMAPLIFVPSVSSSPVLCLCTFCSLPLFSTRSTLLLSIDVMARSWEGTLIPQVEIYKH